jgi:hypothetical protein
MPATSVEIFLAAIKEGYLPVAVPVVSLDGEDRLGVATQPLDWQSNPHATAVLLHKDAMIRAYGAIAATKGVRDLINKHSTEFNAL